MNKSTEKTVRKVSEGIAEISALVEHELPGCNKYGEKSNKRLKAKYDMKTFFAEANSCMAANDLDAARKALKAARKCLKVFK